MRQNHLVFWFDDPDLTDLEALSPNRSLNPPPSATPILGHGVPETRSEPVAGPARPRCRSRRAPPRPCDAAPRPWHHDADDDAQEWPDRERPPSSNSRAPIDQPSLSRSPRNIPPTPRLPPSACGSTLAPAQRLTRQMAPRTFSSISPSRCAPVPPVPLRRNRPADHHDPGHPEADTAAAGARDREHGRPPQRLYLGSSGPRPPAPPATPY